MRANSLFALAGRSLLATLLLLPLASAASAAQNGGDLPGGNSKHREFDPPNEVPPPPLPDPIEIPDSPGVEGPVGRTPATPRGPGAAGNPPAAVPNPQGGIGRTLPIPVPGRPTVCPPSPSSPDENSALTWFGWRGWWARHHDRYFRFAVDEFRGNRRAQTAAGETLFGLQGGQRAWADPQRLAAELPRLAPPLQAWLQSGRAHLAQPAFLAATRLGIEVDPSDWTSQLRGNQQARSHALLALGLESSAQSRARLMSVLQGSAQAQQRFLGERAEPRDRAMAAHALGVLAYRSDSAEQREAIIEDLQRIVLHEFRADPLVQTAAVEAIGIAAAADARASERVRRAAWAEQLMPLLQDERRPREMRAALYLSLARLLADWQPASSARAALAAVCIAQVQERGADRSLQYGAVQAFGLIATRNEGDAESQARWLASIASKHKNRDLRPAAVIALARAIGAWGWAEPAVEETALPSLIDLLDVGSSELQPWAALALGVAVAEARHRDLGAPPASIAEALQESWEDARSAELRAACVLGLALTGGNGVLASIRKEALKSRGREPFPEAIHALGLRGDEGDARAMQAFLQERKVAPQSIRAMGVSLAALGRLDARSSLHTWLLGDHTQRACAAAGALSYFPTEDSLRSILTVLEDDRAPTSLVRASILALAKWRDARPGALREACVSLWNPLATSAIDDWAREL